MATWVPYEALVGACAYLDASVHDLKMPPLCLFGFEKDQTLEEILDNDGSRYLFRLCRLNQITPVSWHMFAAKYQTWPDDPQTIPISCEYTLDDLHSHIDTDRRKLFSNPWLSTSLSFPWIVWRAIDWGRYEDGTLVYLAVATIPTAIEC